MGMSRICSSPISFERGSDRWTAKVEIVRRKAIMQIQQKPGCSFTKGGASRGFSLIELLIVVAVILIIAAISIPNFIHSKMLANEAAAISNTRNITTAEVIYSTTYGIGYAASLVALGGTTVIPDSNDALLIDTVLASGIKSGYGFTYVAATTDSQGHVTTFTLNVDPIATNTGTRHFYTDQTNVIRVNGSAPAGPTDLAIQ